MASHSNALRLSIDPSLYESEVNWRRSPSPTYRTPRMGGLRRNESVSSMSSITTASSYESGAVLFSALVLWDYTSDDEDHLSVVQNEEIYILQQEDSGWWAGLRPGGNRVGWMPSSFLQVLANSSASSVFNFDRQPSPCGYPETPQDWAHHNRRTEASTISPSCVPKAGESGNSPEPPLTAYQEALYGLERHGIEATPPSPGTPMPQAPPPAYSARVEWSPSVRTAPLRLNKPTPPTPPASTSHVAQNSAYTTSTFDLGHGRARSDSAPPRSSNSSPAPGSSPGEGARNRRRTKMRVDDPQSLNRISVLIESNNVPYLASPDPSTIGFNRGSQTRLRDAQEGLMHSATTEKPWYLRPSYTPDQLRVDAAGQVTAGTTRALVERLVGDSSRPLQERQYRNAFLMTFRTFMKPEFLLEILQEQYELDHPASLTTSEFDEWREKRKRPVQERVLIVLTMWLEDHRLLDEEHHIAGRLTEFLSLIVTPTHLALTAKLILQSLERLTFAGQETPIPAPNRRRRKSKSHNSDLLKYDPSSIAEHLCMLEHKLYAKITPQECLSWARTQTGRTVQNLTTFCATHDRLVQWVKFSIMNVDLLGRRADTVDFWIRVAEKCRALNNFSSMAAVLNALSSQVITQLHLTRAHCSRKANLEVLLQYNTPTGGFAGYRGLVNSLEPVSTCVPFVGMFLIDIVHIKDQFPDIVPLDSTGLSELTPISPQVRTPVTEESMISFVKRVRWFDTIVSMLRFQKRTYVFPESQSTREYIEAQMRVATGKDDSHFWERSKSLQQSELHNADIRKGLGQAGF